MKRKVRLKDVAQKLGVSTVTVSNALSGRKGVSPAVRDRIERTAKEMGVDMGRYEKKSDRHVAIGALVADHPDEAEASFYLDLFQKAEQAASTRRGILVRESVAPGAADDVLPDIVTQGDMEGFLVIGKLPGRLLERIREAVSVPVVLLNFSHPDLPCASVLPNNYVGMYRAAQYGVDMGHRKLGFVGSRDITGNIRDRYFGFLRCLRINHIPLQRDWVADEKNLDEKFFLHMPDTLPDLLVCASDAYAVRVYETLGKRGISVPGDVSIVSFGNFLSNHPFGLRLTTYNVDRERMARKAVDILLSQIGGAQIRTDPVYIDSVMIERSSVKDMR